MNFNELIERAHSQAKSMGWWDEERNTNELLMLIVSECGEALEAHRCEKRADMKVFDEVCEHAAKMPPGPNELGTGGNSFIAYSYTHHIKGSFEEELADIVIRIADFMGYEKWRHEEFGLGLDSDNVGESLYAVVSNITHHQRPLSVNLSYAVSLVFDLAKRHNIDLGRHVDLKLEFNKTRGRKHGKAY